MLGGQISPRFTDHAGGRLGPGNTRDGSRGNGTSRISGERCRWRHLQSLPHGLNQAVAGVPWCQIRVLRFAVQRGCSNEGLLMRKFNVLVACFVISIGATEALAQSDAVQWRVEDGGNGHWYLLREMNSLSWNSHRDAATALGGHRTTITDSGENQFVRALIPMDLPGTGENYLFGPSIGLLQSTGSREPAGGWAWVTGEPLTFVDWFPGEPNNGPGGGEHWVRIRFTNAILAWNDVAESMIEADLCCNPLVTQALIEWSADCNDDGIVDYGQILTGQLADADLNGVPDVCDPCAGDITGNGGVDAIDLAVILGLWGTDGQGEFDADVNDDLMVDGLDLGALLGSWGPCP